MVSTLAGRRIGPYELDEEIGRGGMGVVYLARQPGTGRKLAIKLIDEPLAHAPAFLRRFAQEARTGARLQHPNILPILDTGTANGQPYLVMPYMAGGTLAERIAAAPGGLPLIDVVRITRDVAAALDGAHAQAIVHCDVKPGNILLDRQGRAYLADFGIARLQGDADPTGRPPGTPPYLAPEVSAGDPPAPASDIYALGVVIFEMLTGRLPRQTDDAGQALPVREELNAASLRLWRPDAPAGVLVVVAQTLNDSPASRPISASLLADALALAARQVTPSELLHPLAPFPSESTPFSEDCNGNHHTPPPDGPLAFIKTPPPDVLAAHTSIPTLVGRSARPRQMTPHPVLAAFIGGLLLALLVMLFVLMMMSLAPSTLP